MENIIFFIIVAIISSLFRNKQKWVKEQPDQVPQTARVPKRAFEMPDQSIQPDKTFKSTQQIITDEAQNYINQKPVTKPVQKKQTLLSANSDNVMSTQSINKDQLVQGIIWSEILGPPRSKKPHSSLRK